MKIFPRGEVLPKISKRLSEQIKDKTVHIHWGELWEFVAFAKANRASDCARIASRYAHDFGTFGQVSLGESIPHRSHLFPVAERLTHAERAKSGASPLEKGSRKVYDFITN